MILDSEQQRAFLLSVFQVIEIPGKHLEIACQVKQAIQAAEVKLADPGQHPLERVSDDY